MIHGGRNASDSPVVKTAGAYLNRHKDRFKKNLGFVSNCV